MPVIEIQALVRTKPDVNALIVQTARAAANAIGTEERHCWVVFREISPGTYIEGGKVRTQEDALEASPLVTIRARVGRTKEQKAAMLRAVALAVGRGLGSDPDNVWVEYREIPEGHVFTGGEVH